MVDFLIGHFTYRMLPLAIDIISTSLAVAYSDFYMLAVAYSDGMYTN